jgi:hypothetical protein
VHTHNVPTLLQLEYGIMGFSGDCFLSGFDGAMITCGIFTDYYRCRVPFKRFADPTHNKLKKTAEYSVLCLGNV